MKYKVGDKFVVEILGVDSNLSAPYETALSRFTECQLRCIPQLVNGVDMDGYNKGAEEAWELAKFILLEYGDGGAPANVLGEIFDTYNADDILNSNSFNEAKTKLEVWKEKNKFIKIGDIIYSLDSNKNGIVLSVRDGFYNILWENGLCTEQNGKMLIKTKDNRKDKIDNIIGLLK